MTSRVEKINNLWDFAVSKPEGFTWADIRPVYAWAHDRSRFFGVVRGLRALLGATDSINLVCEPQGQGELWLYRLTGTMAEAIPWTSGRVGDIEARLETIAGVSRSLVAATDGRSKDGKKARLIAKIVGRLIEDLQDLSG